MLEDFVPFGPVPLSDLSSINCFIIKDDDDDGDDYKI